MIGLRVEAVPPAEIGQHWGWLAKLLEPAVARDRQGSMTALRANLERGEIGLATIHVPNGAGVITLQPGVFDGVFALWVPYTFAAVKAGPRVWRQTIIGVMQHFEDLAREAGCADIRIGGRDWSFLPGYERFDHVPNRRRKKL